MGREKDRQLRRKKRRRVQLHKYKGKLENTKDPKEREYLIQKINKISLYRKTDIPGK